MKTRFYLIVVLFLLTQFQLSAQEEFFKNTYGITLGSSSNFHETEGASLSIYIKDNIVVSGLIAENSSEKISGIGLSFFITGINSTSSTKGLLGLSLSKDSNFPNYFNINAGVLQIFSKDSKFPFSFSLILNQNLIGDGSLTPVFGYTQTLFSHNQIYPVVGLTYGIPIMSLNNLHDDGNLFFHVGLNIKLNKKKRQ